MLAMVLMMLSNQAIPKYASGGSSSPLLKALGLTCATDRRELVGICHGKTINNEFRGRSRSQLSRVLVMLKVFLVIFSVRGTGSTFLDSLHVGRFRSLLSL